MGWALVAGCVVTLGLGAAARVTTLPPHVLAPPPSTRVLARDGSTLYESLSADDVRRSPATLSRVSPHLVNATLAGEDHRFFSHLGIDPVSVARAAWLNLRAGRVAYGGSTITQQLARLCFPGPRTLSQKLREAYWALVLESHLSKEEILGLYLERAPYGGLLVGVDAASRAYFEKPPSLLSLAEASLLASIPRSPDRYDPRRGQGDVLARRRNVLALMTHRGMVSRDVARAAEEEPLRKEWPRPPWKAPHAVRRVLDETAPGTPEVRTTMDLPLQRRVEELVSGAVRELSDRGVTQSAVLVVELPGGQVRSYVGSADFLDVEHSGQVDGVQAPRSPGSALKPLVYAMAMDQGLTPATVLNDVQQGFQAAQGQYLPRNFDEKEHGPVLARVALANSYNLAAVDLASRLGAPFLLDALRLTGFRLPGETPERLGLGVILGGVDVRLWEVVRAYTALARGGVMLEPSLVEGTPSKGVRVLSSEAAYLVGDILSDDVARSPAFGRQSALSLPFKASVKTGTSKDFRDNWTVGYSTRFLVGVWVGDFSGASMRGVSGITGAGALWHQVMRMAHAGVEVAAPVRPVGVVEQEICAVSGMVPGLHCGSRVVELFKRGSAPRAACTYHPQAGRTVVPEEFEGWTRRVGLPGGVAAAAVRVVFPSHGAEFALDRDRPQEGHGMTLRVTGRGEGHVALELNGVVLRTGKGAVSVVWTATPGRHVVEAVGEDGTRDRAEFLVR